MSATSLLMSFYGDDFTGSTDALESLARVGIRTVLFTSPPSLEQLDHFDGVQAFGVAGRTRAMSPQAMRETLTPALTAMREAGAPIVHYKACSTFDSSPDIGSIGCAIDVGAAVFGTRCVPIVAGAPALGRHCAFGHLFARSAGDATPIRLDRHPNMRNHPVTPMTESDLRLHLALQTQRPISLFDVTRLSDPNQYLQRIQEQDGAVLIDFVLDSDGLLIGLHLLQHAKRESPLFVVGSSGVEAALSAYWFRGQVPTSVFPPVIENGPLLVAVGSCSPVTARQIQWAQSNGFATMLIHANESDDLETVRDATTHLEHGHNVIIHTGGTTKAMRHTDRDGIGSALADVTRQVIERTHIKRLLIAGGDTSGQIADVLQIQSLEMVGELTRGAPLCSASSTLAFVDGIEIVFKGGQIGADDFFGFVHRGHTQSGTIS